MHARERSLPELAALARALLSIALVGALLAGCGMVVERDGAPSREFDASKVPDAVPKNEQLSRYGNPESYEVNGRTYYTMASGRGFEQRGIASWYGKKFHGRRTSSGETYDMYKMTAAHKRLPLPSYVRVVNLENGREAVLKVNDRGPFHDNRVIDVSYAAALKLGMQEKGTAFVEIKTITAGGPAAPRVATARSGTGAPPGVFLQIGAFSQRGNAEQLSLKAGQYIAGRVHIREAQLDGQALYRVQVGPIASVDLADRIVAALAQIGLTEHHFVGDR